MSKNITNFARFYSDSDIMHPKASQVAPLLNSRYGEIFSENASNGYLSVPAAMWSDVALFIHTHPELLFDYLQCVTGIDHGPDANTMEVLYHFSSIPLGHSCVFAIILDRNNPEIPTVSHIWRTADWLERETYDLLGIRFTHHPDLRRILLPADWLGYPLRKDYQEQETYHGIKVAN